ncbi:MAG: VWA domain-containing protein, partial [Anaerolineae bacterium]|nr:VWA domain-containing protein [Anaerolineae bacterium]
MTILLNQLNFRRLKRRLRGCCLLVAVGLLLGCGLLIWLSFLWADRAAAQQEQPHDVLLVIDNSNSMFETAGAGSDPDLLRIQAARLLVAGLAAASQPAPYRVGVIFFGGQAELAAPLTSLADPVGHRSVVEVLNNPTPLAWTDPAAALELTLATLSGGSGSRQTAILLTDGRPEGPTPTTPADPNDQNARLRSIAGRFAMAGIPLHIVLLHNPAVTAEPEMAPVVRPLWPDMAAATGGRLYQV